MRVATARASATLFEKVSANLYGTPEDVTKIVSSLTGGQQAAVAISGFLSSADGETRDALSSVAGRLDAVASSLGGPLSPAGQGNGARDTLSGGSDNAAPAAEERSAASDVTTR